MGVYRWDSQAYSKTHTWSKAFSSGHKCVLALKFEMVMTPHGIMAHLFDPLEGHRHDTAMLQESGLLSQVE